MIIPYEAMTVVSRHAYPNGHPMYVVQFSVPAAPLKRVRVETRIFGAAYSGPIISYNPTQGTCEAQLFHQEAAPQVRTMYLRYNEQAFDAPPDGTPPRVQAAIDGIFELLLQVADRLETLEARVAALEAATPPTPPQEQQHD